MALTTNIPGAGPGTYGNLRVLYWGNNSLTVGAYCSIAEGVTVLLGGEHHVKWVTTSPLPSLFPEITRPPDQSATKGNVVIGNDVWIGMGVTILSGVTIGNGAVIGACSVVSRDVPAYEVWGGNPARMLYTRFLPSEIAALERIAWWNWEPARIIEAAPLLLSGNVTEFIERYG